MYFWTTSMVRRTRRTSGSLGLSKIGWDLFSIRCRVSFGCHSFGSHRILNEVVASFVVGCSGAAVPHLTMALALCSHEPSRYFYVEAAPKKCRCPKTLRGERFWRGGDPFLFGHRKGVSAADVGSAQAEYSCTLFYLFLLQWVGEPQQFPALNLPCDFNHLSTEIIVTQTEMLFDSEVEKPISIPFSLYSNFVVEVRPRNNCTANKLSDFSRRSTASTR